MSYRIGGLDSDLRPLFKCIEWNESHGQYVGQSIVPIENEVITQRQARIEGSDKDKNDDPDFIKAF